MEKVWSKYQEAVFEEVCFGKGNVSIQSRAGGGKTSVLLECIKRLPNKRDKKLIVAFNKKIADEIVNRMNTSSPYLNISTLHSFGLKTIRHHFKNIKIVPNKLPLLITELYPKLCKEDAYILNNCINLCKNRLVDAPSKIDILMDDYGIAPVEIERENFIKAIIKLLRVGKDRKEYVDFTDMLYFCYQYNLKPDPLYDIIFIDETQDQNRLQTFVALSARKPTTRVIIFSDPFQCLNGWNGVDLDVINQLEKKLNTKQLMLPVSYRCPKKIISLAQEIVPDILAHKNSKDGEIIDISEHQLQQYAKPGCFILSRNNATLIKICMQFIRDKIPANIAGKDIGESLLYLIKKSQKKTVDAFIAWLDNWKASETKRCLEKKRSITWINDKYECLKELCDGAKIIADIEKNIRTMFHDIDDGDKVIFSTVHQAKGLERDDVFLLDWTFNPNKNQEEANIKYTAITRSKDQLYIVSKN